MNPEQHQQDPVNDDTNPELMTIGDLEKRTQLSKSFWYQRISEGSLRHFRMGPRSGGIRVSEEQYQDYLRSRELGGEEKPAPQSQTPILKHIRLD